MKQTVVAGYAGLLLACGVSAGAGPAAAGQMTLSDLRGLCSGSDAWAQAACKFFVLGAFEGLSLGGSARTKKGVFVEKSNGKDFCVPADLAAEAMRAKVMTLADADLKAYPADASMPAISFVAAVITRAYPCH